MKLEYRSDKVSPIMWVKFQVAKSKVKGHFRSTNLDFAVASTSRQVFVKFHETFTQGLSSITNHMTQIRGHKVKVKDHVEVSWLSGYVTGLWITRSAVRVPPRHQCPLARYWSTFATLGPGEVNDWVPGRIIPWNSLCADYGCWS